MKGRELITSLFSLNDWINVLDLRKSNQQRDVQITLSYPQCLVSLFWVFARPSEFHAANLRKRIHICKYFGKEFLKKVCIVIRLAFCFIIGMPMTTHTSFTSVWSQKLLVNRNAQEYCVIKLHGNNVGERATLSLA